MIFFTSDSHFSHPLMLKTRGFSTLEEHDETIIANWNARVGQNDVVYHLGDFTFTDREKSQKIFDRLNGRKHLIVGNHDKVGRKLYGWCWVKDVFQIKHNDQKVWMSHYCHHIWPTKHYGSFHLFGHSHGGIPFSDTAARLDVGIDNFPNLISWDEMYKLLKPVTEKLFEKPVGERC